MAKLNRLKPDNDASGNHTTFLEDAAGFIAKYATWIVNLLNPTKFDESKRVDLEGDEHFNKITGKYIDTPHVHDKNTPGNIRNAETDEIPKRIKNRRPDDE